jgi:hypothetical protein
MFFTWMVTDIGPDADMKCKTIKKQKRKLLTIVAPDKLREYFETITCDESRNSDVFLLERPSCAVKEGHDGARLH